MIFKRQKWIKKALCLIFVFLLCINSFAAVISDNDGAAFVTKAEFEELKKNFDEQIDNYNNSIDSKIDGAIAYYLAGIDLAKEEKVPIQSGKTEIYCMQYKSDTETKDMAYVWSQPKVYGTGVTTTWTKNIGNGGCYLHAWTFNSKTPASTGERNLIKNMYNPGTAAAPQLGYAEWVGHIDNVYDDISFDCSGFDYTNGLALHYNTDNNNPTIGFRFGEPVYQKTVLETKWVLFKWCPWFASSGNGGISGGWYPGSQNWHLANANCTNPALTKTSSSKLTNENLIIFKDETYYAFTEEDKVRFLYFDAYDVNGSSYNTKTNAPVLFTKTSYTNFFNVNPGWWTKFFSSVTFKKAYEQYNINDKYETGTCTASGNMQYKNSTTQSGDFVDYYTRTNRILWPCIGFPYKTINNWKQLYKSENDWAAEIDKGSSSVVEVNGVNHLLLKGGWPIVLLQDEYEYKFDVSFKEDTKDHLLFVKMSPFETDDPCSESLWHTWIKGTKPPTDTRFANSILVEAGKSVTLDFVNYGKDNVLYLKWCDRPSTSATSPTLGGGGTIQLPEYVVAIKEMNEKEKEN